jgi:hypothetical protein
MDHPSFRELGVLLEGQSSIELLQDQLNPSTAENGENWTVIDASPKGTKIDLVEKEGY